MKAMDITYALFGGSVGRSGWPKCWAEVFRGRVLGGDCCVFAEEFGGSGWRKRSAEETAE